MRLVVIALSFLYLLSNEAVAVDALEAEVLSADAHRFAEVFARTGGKPTAEDLQAGYLDGAGRGVEIFTPDRIVDAEHLARNVGGSPAQYQRAIDVCLPLADAASAELRSIYLALQGVFPDRELPEVHVVFGAGNSGGTAGDDAQVLGLEVICAIAETEEEIRQTYRKFFAHETIHVLQDSIGKEDAYRDILLAFALQEGMADYIAWLVTGAPPTPSRDAWAKEREATLWEQFTNDRETINAAVAAGRRFEDFTDEDNATLKRWFSNYRSAPEGWPHEVGYWIGRQIITAYVARASDKREAIADLMAITDPLAVLEKSGYRGSPVSPP